jgi:hypothetical protein
MSDLNSLVGKLLAEVLDTIDESDDSVTVRVVVSAGRAFDDAPPVCQEFSLQVVAGEGKASGRNERLGLPRSRGTPQAP